MLCSWSGKLFRIGIIPLISTSVAISSMIGMEITLYFLRYLQIFIQNYLPSSSSLFDLHCFLFLVLQLVTTQAKCPSHWFLEMDVTLAFSHSSLSSCVTSYFTFLCLSYQSDCSSLRSHCLLVYIPNCLPKWNCSQLLGRQYCNKHFVNTLNSIYLFRFEHVHPIM